MVIMIECDKKGLGFSIIFWLKNNNNSWEDLIYFKKRVKIVHYFSYVDLIIHEEP